MRRIAAVAAAVVATFSARECVWVSYLAVCLIPYIVRHSGNLWDNLITGIKFVFTPPKSADCVCYMVLY